MPNRASSGARSLRRALRNAGLGGMAHEKLKLMIAAVRRIRGASFDKPEFPKRGVHTNVINARCGKNPFHANRRECGARVLQKALVAAHLAERKNSPVRMETPMPL